LPPNKFEQSVGRYHQFLPFFHLTKMPFHIAKFDVGAQHGILPWREISFRIVENNN
jgi:hypothetical protein